jgi:signal transduction histidine kinase/AraC-like DNA-binding protein
MWLYVLIALALLTVAALYAVWGNPGQKSGELEVPAANPERANAEVEPEQIDGDIVALRAAYATIEEQSLYLLKAEHLRSRFIATVATTLYSPMALVLDAMARVSEHGAALPASLSRDIEIGAASGRRVMELIYSLDELSRLEAGSRELVPEPFDLVALAGEIVGVYQPLASTGDESLSFVTNVGTLTVMGDQRAWEDILTKLVANALRVTEPKKSVSVALRAYDFDCAVKIELRIQDGGPHIAAASAENIFDRLYHSVEGDPRLFGSSGLGLALVRELIGLQGGRIRVDAAPTGGAVFVIDIELPLAEAQDQRALLSPRIRQSVEDALTVIEAGRGLQNDATEPDTLPCIVLADLSTEYRVLLRRRLTGQFRVDECLTRSEILSRIRRGDVDLLVINLDDTELGALSLIHRLREDEVASNLAILAMSTSPDSPNRIEAMEAGANDVVSRRMATEELVLRIDKCSQYVRQRRATATSHVIQESQTLDLRSADLRFLESICAAIDENMHDENFSVIALAQKVGVSESQLKRRVKKLTGERPVEFIRTRRLERAAKLIDTHWGTIGEIAAAVGFSSPSYFARRYKERYGTAPSRKGRPAPSDDV